MDDEPPSQVGRRLAVWGVTGSGKTTLAKQLGAALGLPVIELDAIRHSHGWDSTDFPEFREILAEKLDSYRNGWVVEGSYSAIMDAYLPLVDTMIWIHLPFRTSFWRLLQRTVRRGWARTQLYTSTGPRESLRQSFFSRKSILWWGISMHRGATRSRRVRVDALPGSVKVYELRSAREVEAFRKRVEGQRAGREAG
jgi:adenylate kinase family enzyme